MKTDGAEPMGVGAALIIFVYSLGPEGKVCWACGCDQAGCAEKAPVAVGAEAPNTGPGGGGGAGESKENPPGEPADEPAGGRPKTSVKSPPRLAAGGGGGGGNSNVGCCEPLAPGRSGFSKYLVNSAPPEGSDCVLGGGGGADGCWKEAADGGAWNMRVNSPAAGSGADFGAGGGAEAEKTGGGAAGAGLGGATAGFFASNNPVNSPVVELTSCVMCGSGDLAGSGA